MEYRERIAREIAGLELRIDRLGVVPYPPAAALLAHARSEWAHGTYAIAEQDVRAAHAALDAAAALGEEQP